MRHLKSGRKLNVSSKHRIAMFRNMVTSLMEHGQIRTTQARAKELRRFADQVISIGKRAPSATQLEGLAGEELRVAKAHRVAAIRRARAATSRHWPKSQERSAMSFGYRSRVPRGGCRSTAAAGSRRGGAGFPLR